MLRSLFALIGFIFVLALGAGYWLYGEQIKQFDPGAIKIYREFAAKLLETGDPGAAMTWSVPVQQGLSAEDVVESMKSIATARNFLFVGESPFYKQVEATTGQPYRYVAFFSFCDANVGKMMLEYQNHYSALMPCRVALVEDEKQRLWLYSMNIDLMIYGGKTLPPELKSGAIKVSETIRAIMAGAARGDF